MSERFKTIAGTIIFGIFVNVLGYQYLFADLETPTRGRYIDLNPVSLFPGDDMDVDETEMLCLAQNIFFESRNQSIEGQYAVAFVTMNRVMHVSFPDTICEVVFQPAQFSWTAENVRINRNDSIEMRAWNQAKQIAIAVMLEDVHNDFYGITHFHRYDINPNWGYQLAMRIDDHKFFMTN